MKSEFFRFQSNWTSYDKVQLESYLKLWTRHLSGKPCCKHSSNSLMLFLSLGMSHQAHWSYLCTRTKANETEYWITCVVKFSKKFYFRLLLRSTPLLWQQRWEARPVFCDTLEYVQVQNKWPSLPVWIHLYDFRFFFNQLRHARKCHISTRVNTDIFDTCLLRSMGDVSS